MSLTENEIRWFCDAWEGRCSGWSRPLKNETAQAGWDAATAANAVTMSALEGYRAMLGALEAFRVKKACAGASPGPRV